MRQSGRSRTFVATARSTLLRTRLLRRPSGHEEALAAQHAELNPTCVVEAVLSGEGER
jgi:hypothetical protein